MWHLIICKLWLIFLKLVTFLHSYKVWAPKKKYSIVVHTYHTTYALNAYVRLTAALRKNWYLQKNLIYPRRVIEPCWAVTTVRRSVALRESLTNHLELKSKKGQKNINQVFLEHLTQQYSIFLTARFTWSGPSNYLLTSAAKMYKSNYKYHNGFCQYCPTLFKSRIPKYVLRPAK